MKSGKTGLPDRVSLHPGYKENHGFYSRFRVELLQPRFNGIEANDLNDWNDWNSLNRSH